MFVVFPEACITPEFYVAAQFLEEQREETSFVRQLFKINA